MGANIEEGLSKRVTHIFVSDLNSLLQKLDGDSLKRFKGVIMLLLPYALRLGPPMVG